MSAKIQFTQETPAVKSTYKGTNQGTATFTRGTYLILNFGQGSGSLPIKPALRTTLGRTPTNSTQTPDVDLAPYAAVELGVSRIHAAIHQSDDTLTVMDMGSRNGTHLNGQRLLPGQQRILRDGDELCLGKLVAHIQFKYGTVPLAPMQDPKATNKLDMAPAPYARAEPTPVILPAAAERANALKLAAADEIAHQLGDTPTGSNARLARESYVLPDFVGQLGQTHAALNNDNRESKFRDRIRDLVNQAAPVQTIDHGAPIEPRQDASMPPARSENAPLSEDNPRSERSASTNARRMLGRLQQ